MTQAPPERDCGFDEDGLWFRYRAAAIILHEGRVLMARNELEPYHYSIGGGVHHGETAEDAVRREVREETGVDMAIDHLAFIHESFFPGSSSLPGRQCHELTFYFVMSYDPAKELTTTGAVLDGAREWHEWVELTGYGRDRPAYPTFFASELPHAGTVRRIVTRE